MLPEEIRKSSETKGKASKKGLFLSKSFRVGDAFNPVSTTNIWSQKDTEVESRTGALTIGSGGYSVAFASGLSPAPLSRFQSPLSEPDVRFSRISALQWDHASCTQVPRSQSWTTPMGLAPVPHSIHVRSRVAARPVDAPTTPSSSDDPFALACDASGVSGPFAGVSGFRHSRDPSPFGHRSSPEAPSLHRHYPASPVLRAPPPSCRPRLPLAGSRFGACLTTHRTSRVATFFPFHACQRHYPGGSKGVPASLASPSVFGLPHFSGGSAPALPVSRPARRSLAFRPACSLSRLMRPFDTRVLQTISLPP